ENVVVDTSGIGFPVDVILVYAAAVYDRSGDDAVGIALRVFHREIDSLLAGYRCRAGVRAAADVIGDGHRVIAGRHVGKVFRGGVVGPGKGVVAASAGNGQVYVPGLAIHLDVALQPLSSADHDRFHIHETVRPRDPQIETA